MVADQGSHLVLGAYMYEPNGRPVWYVGTLALQAQGSYVGVMSSYSGGQTLAGAYRAPVGSAPVGTATLLVKTRGSASLNIVTTDGATSVQIERLSYTSGAAVPTAASFENGLWWNESESGRGFFIDVQGTRAAIASYMYEDTGQPVWYLATGDLNGQRSGFSGEMQVFRGGQTLLGAHRAASGPTSAGPLSFEATSLSTAQLTLPGGRVVPLQRLTAPASTERPPYGLAFEAGPLIRIPEPLAASIAKGASISYRACDVNGDGRDDIIMGVANLPGFGQETPASLRVLLNQGNGTFKEDDASIASGPLPKRVHPRHVFCADFNGDGRQDVFVAAHGWDAPPFPMELNALLVSSNGRWVDQSATLPQTPAFTHTAALADIDGDGDIDIYVGSNSKGPSPYFLINDGHGKFTADTTRLPPDMPAVAEQQLTSALVDINNDGFPDLVLPAYRDREGRVLMNDRTGRFTGSAKALPKPPPVPRGGSVIFAMWVEPLDVDGDGWMDLVLVFTNSSSANGTALQLLRNDRAGGFIDETQNRFAGSQNSSDEGWVDMLRAVDINGDGALDLVATLYQGKTTVETPFLWLNDGNGRFRPVTRAMLKLAPNPNVSLVMDVNGDGKMDIVQASVGQDTGMPDYQVFFNRSAR